MTQIETTPIIQRDPTKLRLAPANKHIIRLQQGTPRYNALVDDIRENGIQDALLIDAEGYVYEGWTRREIAVDLQLKTVPCKVCVTTENAQDVVWRYTLKRKNLTLGQLAYCLVPELEDAFKEAKERRAKNALKTKPTELGSFPSMEQLAASLGFSYELLRQARNVHEAWKQHPNPKCYGDSKKPVTLRDYIEPQITNMDDPISLGGAIKAIGFLVATTEDDTRKKGGKPLGDVQKQMGLFAEVVENGIARWDYYAKWPEKIKERHWQEVRTKVSATPPEKAASLAEYHQKMADEFKKIAKAGKKGAE